jgi:regulation of enolase protein 1 (concanavalin A-like superfamily)
MAFAKKLWFGLGVVVALLAEAEGGMRVQGAEVLFQDDFRGKLGDGWSWIRERREAWRVTDKGLEVLIEPGNMWGPQNDARNVLVRPAPAITTNKIDFSVNVENQPTNQYEQVDLVWYLNDSNMVKLGEELVDGKLSVVMGREEQDKTRTITILPLNSSSVRLRLTVSGGTIRGQFRTTTATDWVTAGECELPKGRNEQAKISIQWYQGAEKGGHWGRVSGFICISCDK